MATRGGADPAALATRVLAEAGFALRSVHETRATVEDAFVAMVRADADARRQVS
jgi:hypothetical protein